MEDTGIFSGHLVYFMALGICWSNLVIFPLFGKMYHEKSGNLAPRNCWILDIALRATFATLQH
jgi:hypothetical protein